MSTPHPGGQRRGTGLAVAWLALGLPVGALVGWLAQLSDRAGDRAYGAFLLVLAAVSLALGVGLLVTRLRWLFVASLTGSAAWLVAACIAVAVADFTADKAWGGGLTGVVAVVTAALAAGRLRRAPGADG